MLGSNYKDQFGNLIDSVDWTIELPDAWKDFFSERGECQSFAADKRQHRRMKARSYGLMWFEKAWSAVPRPDTVLGIYTKDFSQRGCGLVLPIEIYPEEMLRIVLPTFWLTLRVVRCNRMNQHCFDVGGVLIRQSAPSDDAFDLQQECIS